jgi:Domain of unknown function (DUF4314)
VTQIGDKVELIRCNDQYTRLKPGDRGTVRFIDALGTVHIDWHSGLKLGLVREDGDSWKVLERGTPND